MREHERADLHDDHATGRDPARRLRTSRDALTADEVIADLQPKVAHYQCCEHVEFVDAISKSPSGKILRRVLVEQERLARA